MKISRAWLQTFFNDPLPEAKELEGALTFHAFEIESAEGDILDVKVTPNRGHDCLCHRGIAKELAAILKVSMREDPLRQKIALDTLTNAVKVDIQTDLCSRYVAGYVRNVKVGPSPAWLRDSLEAIGQRSINNVVDATNYVMFSLGQPLHAFDAAQLRQEDGAYRIAVRPAKSGETMLALDDKEYVLQSSMLVIADDVADKAIGIAGVKGGKPAGIDESTRDIIIESANFDGVSTRKTAQALKLRTDASMRFEQVLPQELAAYGMRAVADMIVKVAGGGIAGFVDVYPRKQPKMNVAVTLTKINSVLGTKLTAGTVADIMDRLDLPFSQRGDLFDVVVPFERLDLTIPENLVEEVGRIVGYDAVPEKELPRATAAPEMNANFYGSELVREELVSQGFSEVFTSVFSDRGERVVANKIDGTKPFLRHTLSDGLKDALKKNIPNKDLLGLKEVKLFEIGTVWKDGKESLKVGTIKESKSAQEGECTEAFLAPAQSDAYEDLPVSDCARYEPFSRFPYIVRDIALWTPLGSDPDDVLAVIREHAGALLARGEKFDEFRKGERVSFAFRLVFQSFERTLTDAEANDCMEKVYAVVKGNGWEVR